MRIVEGPPRIMGSYSRIRASTVKTILCQHALQKEHLDARDIQTRECACCRFAKNDDAQIE
jgi:hypothetical protein